MRRDARMHRDALIEAAARVFERDGFDVPLEAVLAETGLGRGTLYRHFPNRGALLVAVLGLELDRMAAFVEAHAAEPDLFVRFVRRQGLLSIALAPVLLNMPTAEVERLLAPLAPRSDALFARVADLARGHGVVAASVDAADLRLLSRMLCVAAEHDDRPREIVLERALAIVFDGIAARRPDPAPEGRD